MNSPSTSLLANIAGTRVEDSCTEVLAELLRHRQFAEALLSLLGLVCPSSYEVSTQVVNQTARGRPDLVLVGGGVYLVIESKVWARLTENQPNEYVKDIAAKSNLGNRIVTFLVPEDRLAVVRNKVADRLEALHRQDPSTCEVRVEHLTWTRVRRAFSSVEVSEPLLAYLVESFAQMVETHITVTRLALTEKRQRMLENRDVIESFVALSDLVTRLNTHLERDGDQVKRCGAGEGWFGFSASRGEQTLWIGYVLRAALADDALRLLWVHVTDQGAIARLRAEGGEVHEGRIVGWGGWLTPLKLSSGIPEDQVADLSRQLNELRRLLG